MIRHSRKKRFTILACIVATVGGFQSLFITQAKASSITPFVEPLNTGIRSFAGNRLYDINYNFPFSKNDLLLLTQSSVTASSTAPPFKLLRYDEDYRYLQNSKYRHDFWDPVKFIPLNNRKDWFLSFGGEIRQRYESYHNPNFGSGPADNRGNNDYLLQRYLLHGDLHLGQRFRFFGQFMASLEDGRIGGPRPEVDQNIFDLHQGVMDFVIPINDKVSTTWRLGRQEFDYGSGRLISVREVPNTRRSFDAARVLLRIGQWSIDGFWGKPVRNRFNVFDDDPDPDKTLWGTYVVRPNEFLPNGHIDLYYLGFENKQGVFTQSIANELRHTLGTRLWGQPLPWEYNIELIWQFGQFGTGNINAWAVATNTRYSFSNLPLRPRLGLTADITSGDRNPNSAKLQTYNPLFPTGAYFNLADLLGPSNFIHLHPSVDLHFNNKLKMTLDWGFFWRESIHDAPYSIAIFPIFSNHANQGRFSGHSPAVTIAWELNRNISMLASYVHFFPGSFFNNNHENNSVDYFTSWITYKF